MKYNKEKFEFIEIKPSNTQRFKPDIEYCLIYKYDGVMAGNLCVFEKNDLPVYDIIKNIAEQACIELVEVTSEEYLERMKK